MFKALRAIPVLMIPTMMALAFSASAQAADGPTVNVFFAPQQEGGDQVRTQLYTRDDGITIRIEQRGEELRVWINDEEVPEDRLQREDRTLTIFDAEGNVVQQVPLLADGRGRAARMRDRPWPGGGAASPSGRPGVFAGGAMPPGMPRAQIGIGMGRIDAALAQHLQLDPDEVIIITQVREGAPADRAGLKPHDIIIKVDGDSPVTPQQLQRIVRAKEPGDSVTFTILRAGKEHEIKVEVESIAERVRERFAADPERAQQVQRQVERLRDRAQRFGSVFDADAFRDEFLREFERGLAFEFDEQTKLKLKELAEKAARHAEEYAARLKEEFDNRFRLRHSFDPDILRWFDIDGFEPQRFFDHFESIPGIEFQREDGVLKGIVVTPQPDLRVDRELRPGAAIERMEKRLERLEQQLSQIERTLDRLAEDR